MRTPEEDLARDLEDPENAAYFAEATAESARELLRCGVTSQLTESSDSNKTYKWDW